MSLKLVKKIEGQGLSLSALKAYLRITHNKEDHILEGTIDKAMEWVARATGKTLMRTIWRYTHPNTRIFLPNPPVHTIMEVKMRGRVLEGNEYETVTRHGRTTVEVPFIWGKKNLLSVTYEAGYGKNFVDIPTGLQQAVLTTAAYIYDNRSGNSCGRSGNHIDACTPWILDHLNYCMH